jgi:hypothetical protein
METDRRTAGDLEDVKVNVKIKLSALWVVLMFLYLYADVLAFYYPGIIKEIMGGQIVGIRIGKLFLLGSAVLMGIPSVMVFLSLVLKAKANRRTNIVLGIFHAGVLLATMFIPAETMETYPHHLFYLIAEAAFIVLIIRYAWKWPKREA